MRYARVSAVVSLLLTVWLAPFSSAVAGEVEIVNATAKRQGSLWRFDVTLRHADSGWDHYADRWKIVDALGHELGERVLYHPHQHEQPFTRSLTGVRLPEATRSVVVRAHDSVHGWSAADFTVILDQD